jgi:AcrR family transcriptional regulator
VPSALRDKAYREVHDLRACRTVCSRIAAGQMRDDIVVESGLRAPIGPALPMIMSREGTGVSESVWPEPARPRREPQQARSRARVAQILQAADAILSEEGVTALTVRRIAERADVPVGSIYQFFGDKAAVIDAVARAYLSESDAAIEELVRAAEAGEGDWSDPVGRMLDTFVALYRSHPGYIAIWSGRHMSAEAALIDEANTELIAAGVQRIMAAQAGLQQGPELELAAMVAVRAANTVLFYAFRRSPRGDDAVLSELKKLMRQYLASFTVAPAAMRHGRG